MPQPLRELLSVTTDDDLAALIGRPVSDARSAAARDGTLVRTLRPGEVHTMEFVDGRVNLVVDEADVVVRTFRG